MLACAEVVKLDRGYPLVRLDDGTELRCEHSTRMKKNRDASGKTAGRTRGAAAEPMAARAVIGDRVRVDVPDGHEKAIIVEILPRTCTLVRKDPAERSEAQVLAANFDTVVIAQPLCDINLRRLERELVLAHETGAEICIVLTKADLVDNEGAQETEAQVRALAGPEVPVLLVTQEDAESVQALRERIPAGRTAVLVGRSGVGKSSLINLLVGAEVQATSDVREGDGKGRHTTVSREIVEIPHAGRVVDMPGVRGLGMWEADAGIGAAFSDVEEYAAQCRFRDCRHASEPGCAVRAAVEAGLLTPERLESYRNLKQETHKMRVRAEESRYRKRPSR